jgi:hypothetical protein
MRSTILILLAVCALSITSVAQLPSVTEGKAFEARPGVWRKVVVNHSASSLVAFSDRFQCPKGGPVVTFDALLYSGDQNLRPGGSVEIKADDPSKCSSAVTAAIFSDDHVEGDPTAVDHLLSTRRGAYKALGEATELLEEVQNKHEPVQQAIDALSNRFQANLSDKTEVGHGYKLGLSIVRRMLTESAVNTVLPSDNDGKNLPLVDDVMNSKGVSRDEARIIVDIQRLNAWRSLLAKNLRPPEGN